MAYVSAGRRTLAIGAPIAVGDVAIRVAASETISHAGCALQATYHGGDIDESGGSILPWAVFLGGFPGVAVRVAARVAVR